MWISKIKLNNFRNYEKQEIVLKDGINLFYGENAQGKTNIIESIYLCSVGKSFRARRDQELIKFDTNKSLIEVEFNKSDRDGKIKIEIENKKNISVNGIKLKKLSELLGNINIVIFTPDDIDILKGGPQKRRKFLDVMISQLKPNYMHILNLYLKTLEQRNNYLRQIKFENKNENMLDIWDEKLAEYGIKIFNYRNEFINKIKNKIENIHNKITNNKEKIKIEYISNCKNKQEFLDILKNRRKLDIIKGYTTKGIHRDDFTVYVNNNPVNVYGSQGQHRTAILSLKLSELNVVYDEIGEYPILLLDDFMSELDEKRKINFLENIKNAQVIITCTEKIDIENLKYFSYNIKDGKIVKKEISTK
ncbi:MAG: DNA replication/repair protein RecF [Clostridia bacterium]|nr:DNA replication/repair protein RecF [Clostridia bacterium]